jgi:PAS domain-containing protein
MLTTAQSSLSQFSFDRVASEVNAIVEDLRWLHLELTLRNRCNEVLFQETASIDGLFESAFGKLREKLGVLELSIYLKGKTSFMVAFRDQAPDVHWLQDHTPWVDAINRWFEYRPPEVAPPAPVVNHYTVDAEPVTTIAMPVLLHREYGAAMLVVMPTSNIVPRLKKLLSGLSGSISFAIEYVRNKREARNGLPILSRAMLSPDGGLVRNDPWSSFDISGEVEALMNLDSIGIPAACVIDNECRLFAVNERLEEETGILRGWAVGKSFLDVSVPDREHERIRLAMAHWEMEGSPESKTITFPIKTGSGTLQTYSWFISPLRREQKEDCRMLCMGIPVKDVGERASGTDHPVVMTEAGDSRLSKQYRFMMKYVPFPVFHLDERADILRNANRAFETIVGVSRWEGVPLGDFGTLTVHPAAGDTHPCTFHVLSPNGITFTYHGIVTPLMLYGKPVREVKLDSIDNAGTGGMA